jgi:single-strand DNA-binding protein
MKCLNKVTLIGNAAKDPELRYTPAGTAVCSFTVATNRDWKDSTGQTKTEATFHRVIAWSKLGEIISQYLVKGSKVYLEGRISNRLWKDKDGTNHNITEIVASEMILLDNKKSANQSDGSDQPTPPEPAMKTKQDDTDLSDINFDDLDLGDVDDILGEDEKVAKKGK